MDIREKLVELLEESRISCGENGVRINGSRDIADHLLANGVTVLPVADKATERSVAVEKTEDQRKPEGFIGHRKLEQEWIPVTERLPSAEGEYITYTDRGQIHFDCFCIYPDHGTQFWVGGNGKVTHWMDKPTPPKGE